jgi:hypothetical protein
VLYVSDLSPASTRELGLVSSRRLIALAEKLEHFLYRKALRGAAVTQGICATIEAAGVGAGRVVFMPNGVDSRRFRPTDGAGNLVGAGQIAFLYAGTHGYAQGWMSFSRRLRCCEGGATLSS